MNEIFESNQEIENKKYLITTNPEKIDMGALATLFSTSYWASRRSSEMITRSIKHSLCFSLYNQETQIGFARVVTDYTTFAYLCDVIIQESYRGLGLGTWLVNTIMVHPDILPLRRMLLVTKDAHELYRKLGFKKIKKPEQYMERIIK